MKFVTTTILLGLIFMGAGCTTSKQVQEMIDASHQDHSSTAQAHGTSIDILKQSAAKALEQNEQQSAELKNLQKQLEAAQSQLKLMQGNAEAAKVMSAANTVKVAELADGLAANQEAVAETVEKMDTVDKLFEEVLIGHFQSFVDNANVAIAALQADDVVTTNGASTGLAEPIEIVAPDTSAPTNAASGSTPTNTVTKE